MTRLTRWMYHLRSVGIDAVWIPAGAALVFVWVVALGGEGIRRPGTLTMWSEIVLPGLAAFLTPFAASPARDPNGALMRVQPVSAWRIYLERSGLLLLVDALLGLAANLAVLALALPGQPLEVALQAALVSLPALLFFAGLAQLAAALLGSAPGGAGIALSVWLFFLINKRFMRTAVTAYIYPFMTSFAFSSPAWGWNRTVLTVCAVMLLAGFAWSCGRARINFEG